MAINGPRDVGFVYVDPKDMPTISTLEIRPFEMPIDYVIKFNNPDTDVELMKFCANGEIYHKGKLITTDLEIVEGLKDIIQYYRCTKCKGEIK